LIISISKVQLFVDMAKIPSLFLSPKVKGMNYIG
jgi:hypothetical protein